MSKKVNWADVDKRIRARREVWTSQEKATLEDTLKKLPDVADKAAPLELAQPALTGTPSGSSDAN